MSLSKEQRAAHIASGLCNCCSSKGCSASSPQFARPGKRSCTGCAKLRKKQIRARRSKLKIRHQCVCGDVRRKGYSNCVECAKAEAVKREQKAQELREKGICPRCCKRPVCERPPRKTKRKRPVGPRAAQFDSPKMTECEKCRFRRLEAARLKRAKQLRQATTLEEIMRATPSRKPSHGSRARCLGTRAAA